MLQKLRETPGAASFLPFVRMFYGRRSTYLWTDDAGVGHDIRQGEGCEQGDALSPALFSLGLHDALQKARDERNILHVLRPTLQRRRLELGVASG